MAGGLQKVCGGDHRLRHRKQAAAGHYEGHHRPGGGEPPDTGAAAADAGRHRPHHPKADAHRAGDCQPAGRDHRRNQGSPDQAAGGGSGGGET